MTNLTTAQLDRACGAVLGSAVGDALGAPYEFGSAAMGSAGPQMVGGGLGGFAPGEWTDDTSMAWCVLEVAARRHDLTSDEALTDVARNFRRWFDSGPADMGIQTGRVLGRAGDSPTAESVTAVAADLHAAGGRTAGNGSLMRTGPVALPHLDDPQAVADAARAVAALTHFDPHAQEACVLWSLAIRHAVLAGELDVRVGLDALDPEAKTFWTARIDEAEAQEPGTFTSNGWVVTALQAAWSAIVHTPVPAGPDACRHLGDALTTAIRIGHDTDTVAAIAGALLGACYGASAIPATWRRILHGYPGRTGEELVELATLAARGGPDGQGWPGVDRLDYAGFAGRDQLVRHPHDDGVWLGGIDALDDLPDGVTAVVSLCRLGSEQVPKGVEHVGFRLIDSVDRADNPNLEFVLADAAATVAALRDEGHQVLLHCVAAQSRTPAVAIAYARLRGVPAEEARAGVQAALPGSAPNVAFLAALGKVEGRRAHVPDR